MAHRVISTHILTKRMTMIRLLHAWRIVFQLTSSRRGWRDRHDLPPTLVYFNSHPHEEDDYAFDVTSELEREFQLTSSRRGWQRIRTASIAIEYFNSHPHEEDDIYATDNVIDNIHFNSHPHEEDDSTSSLLFSKKSISTHILTKRMTT